MYEILMNNKVREDEHLTYYAMMHITDNGETIINAFT